MNFEIGDIILYDVYVGLIVDIKDNILEFKSHLGTIITCPATEATLISTGANMVKQVVEGVFKCQNLK